MNVRDQIVSYLAGELGAAESTALRARLREDEQARAEYDALAELVYGASQHEPPLAMQARVFEAVEAALDGAVDAAHAPAAAERKQRWRWLGVLALAAATAAVLALVLWPRPDGTSDPGATPINPPRVQYRGGSGSAAADPRLHLVALELFAISPAGNSASSTANRDGAFGAPRLLADGDAVTLGDYLQLRYRNDDPALRYIYVFGLDGRKAPLSYYPRPSQRTPRRAATGVHSLGRSLRLSHRHRRGPLHVVALLSQQPLDHDAVAKALQAALAGADAVDVGHRLGRLKVGANVRVVHRQLIVR